MSIVAVTRPIIWELRPSEVFICRLIPVYCFAIAGAACGAFTDMFEADGAGRAVIFRMPKPTLRLKLPLRSPRGFPGTMFGR